MSKATKRPLTAPDQTKENRPMPKCLSSLIVILATAIMLLALLPAASASAESPWWQVLTGSRPTNMWEPQDETEVQKFEVSEMFLGFLFAAKIEVGGEVVGCLGSGEIPEFFSTNEFCEAETGHSSDETAAELRATLEAAYGGTVEVSGGPTGVAPFEVKTPGRWVQPAKLSVLSAFGTPLGKATTQVTSKDSGHLVITATNLGETAIDATKTPVTITDKLPEGVIAWGAEAFAGAKGNAGPVDCSIDAPDEVSCTFEGELPSYEAIEIEVFSVLTGSPPDAAAPGAAPGEVSVSGGDAPSATASQPVKVSPDPTPFGLERFSSQAEEEGGAPSSQAGAHPLQFTTTVQLNSGRVSYDQFGGRIRVEQPELPRNVNLLLPAGLVGNATAVAQCDVATFMDLTPGDPTNECPDESAIGVSSVTVAVPVGGVGVVREAVPVFNLSPGHGEPARFGFLAGGNPILIDTALDPDNEYKLTASVHNVTQVAQFLSSTVSLWGTPGDPRHDSARGWNCAFHLVEQQEPCERPGNLTETAFLRQPVSCASPLQFPVGVEPWNVPLGSVVERASSSAEAPIGCNKVPFDPSISAAPTSKLAENPSGLSFSLTMPNSNLLNKDGIAEGQPKRVEVMLPEGMTLNPSAAEGLAVCSPSQYASEKFNSKPGEGCPDASKIGNVEIDTPLVKEQVKGTLYIAAPHDNPFDSLLATYIVARIPERGVLVKLPIEISPDPKTGQLIATVDNAPQVPFSSFDLNFREGGRAPLVTPPACGNYDVVAKLVPWSAANPDNPAPSEVITRKSTFTVQRGADGGACPPGGAPPFKPDLTAGTINNAAGSFSPFNVRLTRKDGEQEFTNFSIKLPPGVAGKLAGVPFCSDAAIARAASRTGPHGGAEELADPSCPAASQVGRTLAGAGVGSILTYAPGKIYLTGPYHGAPVSLVSITSGVVGPFDIGTVVVRLAIKVNPETGEVFLDSTGSDPIPHIIQGVVLHLRDIRAYTDRPEFTFNPTSCERTSTAATVLGSGLDFVSAADDNPFVSTSPFQAADCAALSFAPKLSLSLAGGTKRGDFPKLKAFLRMKGFGEAGIAQARVTLPRSEFIANAHFNTICTRVQFKEAGGNGEACPAGSVYGWARAKTPILSDPLEGPIFLRSSEHQLPDVVASLRGQEINVHLVGHVDSVKGQLRNTFESVPDAPVEWASFSFKGGKKGLFENSTNLCRATHKAKVEFDGQNGKASDYGAALKVKCKGKGRGKKG